MVNNAFIRKSTTNYTLDSVKGSPYTLSSDGRTFEDHARIEFMQRDRESLEESFDSIMAGKSYNRGLGLGLVNARTLSGKSLAVRT
jgi:hypothetical protein